METVKEEKVFSDHSEELEIDAKPVQDEVSESDTERLSDAESFRRGQILTRSLPGRARKRAPSMESVAAGKSGGFFGSFFGSKSKKDTHKDTTLQLQKSLDECNAKVEKDLMIQKDLQKENDILKSDNAVLNNVKTTLERRNEKLLEQNKSLTMRNEEVLASVGQALKACGDTFAKFESDDLQRDKNCVNAEYLQIGSGNTQNILTLDKEGLDSLFSQHNLFLENIMEDFKETKYNLQIAKSLQEQMGNQMMNLEDVLKEMKDALIDARSAIRQDVSMELLDYTLSWTDPKLIDECVEELQNLPDRSDGYKFKDLEGKAKVGVLRICKKYENRMNLKRFVQRLEMEDHVSEEKPTADTPLQKDDCASLLVQWVKLRRENDADELIERFPRIKPGRSDTKRDNVVFPSSIFISTDSLNSQEDLAQKTEQFRERLMKDIKYMLQQEFLLLKPKLEEIKTAVVEKGSDSSVFV